MNSDSPANILALEAFLRGEGLTVVRREGPDRKVFGNMLIEWADERIIVRIVKDRGIWLLEVADPSGQGRSPDPALMMQLMVGTTSDLVPLDEEIEFVQSHWSAIVDAFSIEKRTATNTRLHELAKARAKRLFGYG
ncbi:MAG TPA: hypothetical protein VHX68_03705 [Planctomycetaceae bacterium]|jgi:hypothetical protein|nr:hypothetical protein [Planctomycetaceae bacterium]